MSDTEVNLTWDRVGSGETSITIWRSTAGDAYQKLATLPAGSDIFNDISCYPLTTYSYEVTADNAAGSSLPSAAVSATTQANAGTLNVATGFTAAAVSPFTINVSWTDTNTGGHYWFLERSADGVSYSIIADFSPSASSVTYSDSPLSPSSTYYYRVRCVSGSAFGPYSSPVSAATAPRSADTPVNPLALAATVNSATSTTLTWTDTNNDSASYLIETAPYSWSGPPNWTQVGQTAVGATSYNLTTTAETFYYVRIRATNSAGDSGYTPQVIVRSASPGTSGGAKVYMIGPGQTYTSLAAFNWSSLGPGDTVEIFPNKDSNGDIIPYYEKPLISVRGTAANPINIVGMPDPATGQLPIIDGTNATSSPQWAVTYMPLEDLSLVLIGARPSQTSPGWSPGYFNFDNIEVRNGYSGDPSAANNTYTASDGTTRDYAGGSVCGIYIEDGDHITIDGCTIDGNNEGIFGAGQGDTRNLEEITLDSNDIYNNGTIGSFETHNSYLEGINTIYQFNKYGPLRVGAAGTGLKDRGAGTIIRYNDIEAGGHLIDLVEAENYASTTLTLASYGSTYVYGNLLYDGPDGPFTPIYAGCDSLPSPFARTGALYFYNNTVVNLSDQSTPGKYYIELFDLPNGTPLDARNNIIAFVSPDAGTPSGDALVESGGFAYFGTNWVSPGWQYNPGAGNVAGTGNFITNAQNNPGFVNLQAQDFELAATAQAIGQEGIMTANLLPLDKQYVDPASGTTRDGSSDMGAFEYGD